MAAPMSDYKPQRFGASPPATLPSLRTEAGLSVLSACGVPVSLVTDADGTSQRESWRRFIMGSVEPLLGIVAQEVEAKLEQRVTFDLSSLWAHDLCRAGVEFQSNGDRGHGSRARGRTRGTHGGRRMTTVKALATELKLTTVSVATHCRSRGIQTFRRLPDGANSGQMQAHVKNDDARQVRRHYADRLADRSG